MAFHKDQYLDHLADITLQDVFEEKDLGVIIDKDQEVSCPNSSS